MCRVISAEIRDRNAKGCLCTIIQHTDEKRKSCLPLIEIPCQQPLAAIAAALIHDRIARERRAQIPGQRNDIIHGPACQQGILLGPLVIQRHVGHAEIPAGRQHARRRVKAAVQRAIVEQTCAVDLPGKAALRHTVGSAPAQGPVGAARHAQDQRQRHGGCRCKPLCGGGGFALFHKKSQRHQPQRGKNTQHQPVVDEIPAHQAGKGKARRKGRHSSRRSGPAKRRPQQK